VRSTKSKAAAPSNAAHRVPEPVTARADQIPGEVSGATGSCCPIRRIVVPFGVGEPRDVGLRLLEPGDPLLYGGEGNAVAALACGHAERDGAMRFAGAACSRITSRGRSLGPACVFGT